MIIFKATALFADENARKYESTLSEFRYRAMTNFRRLEIGKHRQIYTQFHSLSIKYLFGHLWDKCSICYRRNIAGFSTQIGGNRISRKLLQLLSNAKRVKLSSKLSDVSATVTKYRNTTKTQSHYRIN